MNNKKIMLKHGEGGMATKRLIDNVFANKLNNPILARMEDSAIIQIDGVKYAFT
ncbi:hydrogenase expression/formation protein HypE, partial [bacterium]